MHASTALSLPRLPPGFLRGTFESAEPQTHPETHRRDGLTRTEHESRIRAPAHPRRTEDTDERSAQTASASLSYQRTERTSLFLTTQEGDTVELKIRARDSATIDANQRTDNGNVLSEFDLRATSTTRISLSVEGELNADELAAIRSVFDQVGSLAQDFFEGDLPSAFAAAEALAVDATQLASVGLRMSMRETFTYSQRGTPLAPAAATPPSPAPIAQTPSANPRDVASAAPATAPEISPAPATTDPAAPAADTAAVATDPATPPVSSPSPAPQAVDLVRGFLTHLLERLNAPVPGTQGTGGAGLEVSFKLRLFQSMVTAVSDAAPTSAPAASPLPALVPETLDALAAQQAPPLHAMV